MNSERHWSFSAAGSMLLLPDNNRITEVAHIVRHDRLQAMECAQNGPEQVEQRQMNDPLTSSQSSEEHQRDDGGQVIGN